MGERLSDDQLAELIRWYEVRVGVRREEMVEDALRELRELRKALREYMRLREIHLDLNDSDSYAIMESAYDRLRAVTRLSDDDLGLVEVIEE